ncbi:MAG: hypothetical protein AAF330_04760 [Pseudomonadota bacterium]
MTFDALGWQRFPSDPELAAWVTAARPIALALAADPACRGKWLRHAQTWFAGVNLLPNASDGSIGGVPLAGAAVRAATARAPRISWDQAQVSVCYPGYPGKDPGESDASHRFRRERDAAHVDGLLPIGPARQRRWIEHHAFVLGIPISATSAGAAPMVVWEGSHHIMRAAFGQRLDGLAPERWPEIDLTETYHAARRRCLKDCPRRIVHAQPGEAYLVHRLALHGIAPWARDAPAPEEGRAILYFRPEVTPYL